MAEMTIRLRVNPQTGKKDIVVNLRSDEDSLPHEHEQQHKQLVDKLIEGGLLKAGEAGKLIVQREEEAPVSASPLNDAPVPQRRAEEEGN
jgi:hypothetical protein